MKKNMFLRVLPSGLLFLHFALLSPAYSATVSCDSCTDCSTKIQSAAAGDIIMLANDLTLSSGAQCISFNGRSDVSLDCDGYGVIATGKVYYGIHLGSGGSRNTVQNCTVDGFTNYGLYLVYGSDNTVKDSVFVRNGAGISVYRSNANSIENVVLKNNSNGIGLYYDSENNIIKNSHIMANYASGISLNLSTDVGDPDNNTIFNNYLNNTGISGNISVGRSSTDDRVLVNPNSFNESLNCAGESNILGCSCMGGNFWTNSQNTGYSDTCDDLDADGICDAVYNLSSNNVSMEDVFPLTMNGSTCCVNPDKDNDGFENVACGGNDCDDSQAACGDACSPAGREKCDGFDNDCNGLVDDSVICDDTLLSLAAKYPTIIDDHSCVEDSQNHMVYCFGGNYRATTDRAATDMIVSFDPATGSVLEKTARLPTIRSELSCTENSDSHRVYCFGGYWQEFFCTVWEPWGCVGGYTISHYLDDIVEYDPSLDTITEKTARLPEGMDNFSCVEDSGSHKIYCFGGNVYGAGKRDDILQYDPVTDSVTVQTAVLPSARDNLSCVEDSRTHKMYCFGGFDGSSKLADILEYDPATDTLVTKNAVLPVALHNLSCAEDSNTHKIYCFGGHTQETEVYGSMYVDRIFEYDPFADTLVTKEAKLPMGRFAHSCVEDSSSHKMYCLGGARNVVYFNEITNYTATSWLPGDTDHDCDVDDADLATLATDFGRTDCQPEMCPGNYHPLVKNGPDTDVDGGDIAVAAEKAGATQCL